MEIVTKHIDVPTNGHSEVHDITEQVEMLLHGSALKEGLVTVFVTGSTASVTTTEFEPGLRRDIPEALERLAPQRNRYHHDDTWHDGNGFSHVRASLMGPSLTIPFSHGELSLGTWQQIVLIDHDNRARQRDIVVQFMGI
ncbi:MAG TPA: secondary thiamine-phosphate synthase enzyme YjbQ [Bacteroidota bacterium]|nr:secondary thiamine-phosphate synthase enzyme YjbQ [Bacteroidota bacterium]